MKTIKEINKLFDDEFCKVYPDGSSRFLRSVSQDSDKEIKEFWNKQILSLIEELEGKLPKINEDIWEDLKIEDDWDMKTGMVREGFNQAVDQMRATIKSYKKGL